MSAARSRFDAVWVGLFFLAAYELLRQHTLYGDGGDLVQAASVGIVEAPRGIHLLYLPLLDLLRSVFDGFGVSVFDLASHLSCVATALGVALAHAGFRILGMSRREAALGAALVGAAPGVVFFATVVEYHGVAFGAAALSFVATALLVVRPGIGSAALLGTTTGLAYLAHASGVFLLLPMLCTAGVALFSRNPAGRPSGPRCLALSGVAGLLHAALVWGVPWLLRADGKAAAVSLEKAHGFVMLFADAERRAGAELLDHLVVAAQTVWYEWLLAFFPISWIVLAACLRREVRWSALALIVSLLPYFGVCFLMLGGHNEHGAYFTPLAWPAAWITLRCCPRLVPAALVLSAVVAVTQVVRHDQPERSRAFAEGLRAVAGEAPVGLLIGPMAEQEALLVRAPDVPYLPLEQVARIGKNRPETVDLQLFDSAMRIWFDEGRRVFLTAGVEELVGRTGFPGRHVLSEVILPHIRATYRLLPVEQGGFRGQELLLK